MGEIWVKEQCSSCGKINWICDGSSDSIDETRAYAEGYDCWNCDETHL